MLKIPNEFFVLSKNVWPMLIIFAVVLTVTRIFYLIEHNEKFVLYKEFFSLVFIIYILLLFGLVTSSDIQSFSNNYVPFKEILRYEIGSKQFYWNVVGNIVIFVPFGYLISYCLQSNKMNKPLLITFITSLTIEIVQTYIGRSFDIDDIMLNCLGGITGFLIYIALTAIQRHLPKFFQRDMFYNLLTVILIITIIWYIFNLNGIVIK